MNASYTYIPSVTYINTLVFDHVETYSFQRGKLYEEQTAGLKPTGTQYIINASGELHYSAVKTHTFKNTDQEAEQIRNILQTVISNVPAWMCAPFYRDALVFYDAGGKIISTLNICLSCEYMALAPFVHIEADEKAYTLFRDFFIGIGHEVEADA